MWAIHGSIANQGDSQIEGFATQISTNAGQTVTFKIDTASSGYNLDIYRLGYYGGNGARLITTMHHSGAANQPNPIFNDRDQHRRCRQLVGYGFLGHSEHCGVRRLFRQADDGYRQFPEHDSVHRPQRRHGLGHPVPDQRHDLGSIQSLGRL